jgi:HD-like signal output (HDOD) protein
MLDKHPPHDLAGWLALVSEREMPVLRQTTRRLDLARQDIDRLSGRDITDIVLQDPLLAVRVVAYAVSGGRLQNDITNIASAVMMLGVDPFFRKFERLLTLESLLRGQPQALLGVLQVIVRTQRAARYAHEWAFARHDMNVEEVALAALLHDLAEILLWCFAPQQAMEIRSRLHADRSLRSASAQQEVLGFPLADLQLALCHAWHLPELLTTMMDEGNAHLPRVQNVKLAVNLARHSTNGWTDPAIANDFTAVENLLRINRETLLQRLQLPPEVLPGLIRAETSVADAGSPDRRQR